MFKINPIKIPLDIVKIAILGTTCLDNLLKILGASLSTDNLNNILLEL